MDGVSAAEMVDSGLILRLVKPKSMKIGVHYFPAEVQQLKGQCEASTVCGI